MIKFQEPAELELVVSFDEKTETTETITEVFHKGDMADADVIDVNENFGTCTLQFADGSVAYGVPMKIFGVMVVGNPTRES